jgi:Mg2+ and Co2+ transporter CorA
VTSFPPRWLPPLKDALDIHENILSIINSGSRERIRNVFELAMVIVGRCYGAYDRHGIGSEELQFLDIYESWIGAVMDDEVKLFELFKEDSEAASEWLRNPRNLRETKREQAKLEKGPIKKKHSSKRRPVRTFTVLRSREESDSNRHDFVENLLDIGLETALLKEVKDIQDELHMLLLVFQHQLQVLPSMESAMKEIWAQERWSTAVKRRIEKVFDDHRRTINYPRTDVERMEKQAHRIYKSVTDLLDLKQKHANAIEARYAREQTDATSRQGQTFMVFTTVTVIFLPLSFIAAFFAIDIRELPHTGDSQVLSMEFVSKSVLSPTLDRCHSVC